MFLSFICKIAMCSHYLTGCLCAYQNYRYFSRNLIIQVFCFSYFLPFANVKITYYLYSYYIHYVNIISVYVHVNITYYLFMFIMSILYLFTFMSILHIICSYSSCQDFIKEIFGAHF